MAKKRQSSTGDLKGQDTDSINGGFIQKGGREGAGHQIRVRADEMTVVEDTSVANNKGRKTKLSTLGLDPQVILGGDPAYKRCLYQANKYRKQRMRELGQLHGHVSSGAGALLASASLALAASRLLYERYSKDVEDGGGDPRTLTTAAKLADSARQNELAAWELSAREGIIRRRQDMSGDRTPWLLDAQNKGGRPKKAALAEAACEPERPVLDSYVESEDG